MKEPPALIPGSYVSPELAAHVMYDKYVMSMPLYRHEKDYTHPAVQGFLYCNKLFEYERSYREKGLKYSNECRPFMMNYLKDGAYSLSNNLSENSIRPVVVGRKNWLFSDTPAEADASMKVYSIIETAKANELDPQKYLSFLLEHHSGAEMSDDELEQLASWGNWHRKLVIKME